MKVDTTNLRIPTTARQSGKVGNFYNLNNLSPVFIRSVKFAETFSMQNLFSENTKTFIAIYSYRIGL